MLQQENIMSKTSLPSSKKGPFIVKNSCIPNEPDMPTGCNQHFHEKMMSKSPSSISNNLL
jgi:hypothetical protein